MQTKAARLQFLSDPDHLNHSRLSDIKCMVAVIASTLRIQ